MNKKLTILFVLKALESFSSKQNPLSQIVIAKGLELYGIKCDRKTIARDIRALREFGYDIQKVEGKGFYLKKRQRRIEYVF